jgi:predicted  nucleic acid-binding Zn-ribbon protein
MDEQLSLLIALQEIDTKIRAVAGEKNRLPGILAALERRRDTTKEELDKAKEALQTAQKNKRDRDKDLEAGVQKIEKLKSRTSDIKTNKEYTALLKEIETAEQEDKAIEDEILGLMEKIDAAGAEIASAEKHAAEEEVTIETDRKQHEAEFSKLEEELKALEQTRQNAASRLWPSALARYQKLVRAKSGAVVVATRGESCSGCHMSIPPQVYVNVKKNDSIIGCPHCGRILYSTEPIVQKKPDREQLEEDE